MLKDKSFKLAFNSSHKSDIFNDIFSEYAIVKDALNFEYYIPYNELIKHIDLQLQNTMGSHDYMHGNKKVLITTTDRIDALLNELIEKGIVLTNEQN